MPDLSTINGWKAETAREELLRCCGSHRWAERMDAERPFTSDSDVFTSATQIWFALEPAHWLEAFSAHPRIGGKDALREKFASTRGWARGEQARVSQALVALVLCVDDMSSRGSRERGGGGQRRCSPASCQAC